MDRTEQSPRGDKKEEETEEERGRRVGLGGGREKGVGRRRRV